MKRYFAVIGFFLVLALTTFGAEPEFVFTDAKDLALFGKLTPDTFHTYSRLPESLKATTRPRVWDLGCNSAGLFVRFRTDAGEIKARWTVYGKGVLDNMTRILKMGMALYAYDKGEWVYVSAFRPWDKDKDEPREFTIRCSKMKGEMHEYMVYLPMYDEIRDLAFGVPAGCTIEKPQLDSPRTERPVIAYGTSILQGASASHPGLAGANLLSRKLDRVVVNLGFSGNAKLDMEIAEFMASHPNPGAYILDNAPNGSYDLIKEKQEAFYRILRNAHPDTPIIFVEQPIYPRTRFDAEFEKDILGRNKAMNEVFQKLKKAGEKNIYLVKSEKMLLQDNIGTVEGIHFTDIAFERWADALYKALNKATRGKGKAH